MKLKESSKLSKSIMCPFNLQCAIVLKVSASWHKYAQYQLKQ